MSDNCQTLFIFKYIIKIVQKLQGLLIHPQKKSAPIQERCLFSKLKNYFLSIHFLALTKASCQGETSSFLPAG
jgi:hypothetical protein